VRCEHIAQKAQNTWSKNTGTIGKNRAKNHL